MVHIRFEGKSRDVEEVALDLEEGARERRVREAVARFLDVDLDRVRDLVVERTPGGEILVRPEAVFGQEKTRNDR